MIFLSFTVILFAAIGVEFERIISSLTQGSDSGEHESCEKLDKSGDSRARARKIARRTGFWIESREKNAPLADCHWLRFFYCEYIKNH